MADSKTVDAAITDSGYGRFQVGVMTLCGVAQAADMIEIQFASLVSQALQCEWRVSDYWQSLIASSTFAGLLLGSMVWGPLGDKFSRKTVASVCACFVMFYGLLTALAPNIQWVVLLRFIVGFGIGGLQPLVGTILIELMPTGRRATAWYVSQALWSFGGVVEVLLAWAVLSLYDGWRLLALLSALPMLVLIIPWLLWLPESPRQSLLRGDRASARRTVNRIARSNGKPEFDGDFIVDDLGSETGNVMKLFNSLSYLRLTLQIAMLQFIGGFAYYGQILLNVQLPLVLHSRCSVGGFTPAEVELDRNCHPCAPIDFLHVLVPTLFDVLTSGINAALIQRLLPRRIAMAASFTLGAICIPLLSFCMNAWTRTGLFTLARFMCFTAYCTATLYTVEAYPTSLRATAASYISSFSRLASVLVPFVSQVFLKQVSVLGCLLIFSGLMVAAAVCSALLPFETKDLEMPQTTMDVGAKADFQPLKDKTPSESYGSVGSH